MFRNLWLIAGLLALALASQLPSKALAERTDQTDQTDQAGTTVEEARDPASTDQVFTAEYLERINGEKQAADHEAEVNRARHEKMMDFYTKFH